MWTPGETYIPSSTATAATSPAGPASCPCCAAPCSASPSTTCPTGASPPRPCGCGTPARPCPRRAAARLPGPVRRGHAFRFAKGHLGLTAARVRTPEQADRWVRLVMAASAQLLLARPLAADLRRPWEKGPGPARPLPPGRVRRGFANIRSRLGTPARVAKPARPGPGGQRLRQRPGTPPPGAQENRQHRRNGHASRRVTRQPTREVKT